MSIGVRSGDIVQICSDDLLLELMFFFLLTDKYCF